MAKVDKTMTAMVQTVRKDRTSFMITETDGTEQWFRLGGTADGCPEKGMIVRIGYNVSPGNDEYPDPTYWCNSWTNTNGSTPTSEPNPYEAKAQEIEQAESAQGAAAAPSGNIRRFDTNDAISMAVCIKAVVDAQVSNQSTLASVPDIDPAVFTITPTTIAEDAEMLFQMVFVLGHPQVTVSEPVPQDDVPMGEYTGP